LILADIEHDDDVGMTKACNGPRFARESLAERLVFLVITFEQLDGDEAIQQRIVRKIERPHSAGAKAALDLVSTNPISCHGSMTRE
jgi:hypothetical protein